MVAATMRRVTGTVRALLLVLALGVSASACSTPIRHGLDEPAANEVMAALERAGIAAEKVRDETAAGAAGGGSAFVVRVADEDAVRALDLLHSLGLPRGRRSGFAEVYAQPSLVPTSTEERARYVQALSGEIERTLESVDGVVSARVHLVMAEVDPLAVDGKPRVAAQAAVLLKARAGLPPIKEAEVQKLVAGSIPGLVPAAVAVVVTAAADAPAAGPAALEVVGPLRMSPGSRPLLLAALAGGLGVLVLLALLLLFTVRRLAATQRRLSSALRLDPDAPGRQV
jgi:type III secretion protein J